MLAASNNRFEASLSMAVRDASALEPQYAIRDYTVIRELRVTTAPVSSEVFGRTRQIPAQTALVLVRRFELDEEPVYAVVDAHEVTLALVRAGDLDAATRPATSKPGVSGQPTYSFAEA